MKRQRMFRAAALSLLLTVLLTSSAFAQRSSLFYEDLPPRPGPAVRLSDRSFYFQELPPPEEIKLHDIITVIVDERSQVTSEGELERRKNARLDATLKDWIKLDGLSLKPAPQPDGDPRINGSLTSQYRAEAELATADGMRFKIAATVVDIRPNGNLVIEAHRQVRNNDEVWEQSLTGLVRPEDVLPNNTVLSEDVAEIAIHKRERGSIYDGYRRGWALRFYDFIHPF